MNAPEKVIMAIREGLLDKHGEDFALLSQDQQYGMILMVLNENLEQMRKENRRRKKG